MGLLVFFFQGKVALALVGEGIRAIGLGGAYFLIAILALGFLYLWVRLILRYRLQKKALEYQYLLTLAERHGVIVIDPKAQPELAAELAAKKNLPAAAPILLNPPDSPPDPDPE